jgi:hypothetical protein
VKPGGDVHVRSKSECQSGFRVLYDGLGLEESEMPISPRRIHIRDGSIDSLDSGDDGCFRYAVPDVSAGKSDTSGTIQGTNPKIAFGKTYRSSLVKSAIGLVTFAKMDMFPV